MISASLHSPLVSPLPQVHELGSSGWQAPSPSLQVHILVPPGNRLDLLVRAPDAPSDKQSMTFYVTRRVVESDDPSLDSAIRRQNKRANTLSGFVDRSASPGVESSDFEANNGAVLRVHVTGVQEPAQYLPTLWPSG